ncbi:MAG: PAS domain S-box protein [Anaerolineales bacterium]|nr:PAS domain S-box protein [Anaerolineales bacterium]
MTWVQITHPDNLELDLELYHQMQTGVRDGYQLDKRYIRKDGTVIDVTLSVTCERNPDGTIHHALAHVIDVTDRKVLEEALRQSEERYRLLADGSPLPIAVIDAETGKVVYANPRATAFFGVQRSDVIGRSAAEFYSDPKKREPFVALVREQGYVADFEVLMHTRGGQESWVSVSTTSSTYQGRPAFQSVYLDITKRKQAEAALLQSEQRYRLLAENMTDVVWVLDVETGYFTYVSPSVERLRGYTAEEVIAQPASEALTPESQALVATILTKSVPEFMAGNVLQNPGFDVEQPRRDGTTVWTEAVGRFYRNEENGHLEIYGVSRDLTERRAKEAEIRRLNQELEQRVVERTAELSQALDELRNAEQLKDSFLASVSHELRTPLTGVLGMADALEMQVVGPLNEHQRRYVQQIQNSGERLLKMVNSILHYTALLAGKVKSQPEPCRLLELCAISMRTIRPAAELKKQTMKLNIDPHDLEITSDPDGLIQILNNLLDNAVKFTPEGGAIGLEVVNDPAQKVVHFTVWDTGIGASAAYLKRLASTLAMRSSAATNFLPPPVL